MNTPPLHEPEEPFEWSRILVSGPEAQSFLQGQLSQDVANVGGEGVWSALLTPTSLVLTSCFVSRGDEAFSLLVPRELGVSSLARLRRFHLRVACELELTDVAAGPFDTIAEQVRHDAPGPFEFAKDLTPQCFGAAFVASTVSFTKGCFTGQELVGRLDARGSSVPWRLVRCVGPSTDVIDAVLTSKGPEGASGVTTAVRDGTLVRALGFIHRSALHETTTLEAAGVKVDVIG